MTLSVRVALLATLAFGSIHTMQDPGRTQSPSDQYREIATADSALFTAFNHRDLDKLRYFFANDLEFYQDNEGVSNFEQTMKDFGQMFAQPAPIRRELVAGSLEVHPVKSYGALQVGRHRFCHLENGKDDCGTFSFVHIWRRTKSGWQISRVVSYGHR